MFQFWKFNLWNKYRNYEQHKGILENKRQATVQVLHEFSGIFSFHFLPIYRTSRFIEPQLDVN